MSVIQKIRDKYARVAVIAIALALLGFILMDAFAGRGSIFGGGNSEIGEIDGKEIDAQDFTRKVAEIQKAQGPNVQTEQLVNYLWQLQLNDIIMGKQYKALGLTVTDKELDQMIYVPNPSQTVLQAFGNPQSWDPNALRQRITQMKRGTPAEQAQVTEVFDGLRRQVLLEKYTGLMTNSVYVPKWFLEKRNADNSQMAKASYLAVPYTTIADSTVKVTDEEINDYVKAHKTQYEQKEESRSISYVLFSAAPSSADSAAVRNTLLAVKDSFTNTAASNLKNFLTANRSQIPYNELWYSKKDLQQIQIIDTIFKSPVGIATGPYVEPSLGGYAMVKVIDKKNQPDTAKVRHILISTATPDPQTRQLIPVRDSVSAKKTADSVMLAIANGANFDSVLAKVSEDPSKTINKGVFDSVTRDAQLMQEFKDFALNNPVGYKGIARTAYGYHYMEVLNQRGNSEVIKLAALSLPIDASPETQSQAQNEASMFAGNATDEKSFNDYFEKNLKAKGYNKLSAPGLQPMAYNINGINGSARQLVKSVFEADKGDVINPQLIGSNYVVTLVTDVSKPGLLSATAARPTVEPALRNKKKAEIIKKQMGTVTDLDAFAAKFNQSLKQPTDSIRVQSADSIRFSGGNALGYEQKVLGALFNPAMKGKVAPEGIAGQFGVYAIRVDATFTGAVENANLEEQRKMMEMQNRQQMRSPVELLQKRAKIKDNRARIY